MSGILWLASYPKSGNTWLRAFVANLRKGSDHPININDFNIPVASSRRIFDEAAGIEASDLTAGEIERYRPHVYRYLAQIATGSLFLKIHDAYTILPDGEPLIPAEATRAAIYVVRNPLDVAISFAHHANESSDWAIGKMASREASFSSDLPIRNLNQRLLSWSDHVLSWVDGTPFPVHVIRYEDMHDRPLETFSAVAGWCGLPCDVAAVQRAILNSSFEQLQEQERAQGFKEKPAEAVSFFRQGKAHAWKDVLSKSQVARIVQAHGTVMRRFGYYPFQAG